MMSGKFSKAQYGRSGGFSLVELMVALLIGLLILLGAGQLFLMSKRSYDHASLLATRQEAVRSLFDIVSLDIRTAESVDDNSGDDSIIVLVYGAGSREEDPYCASGDGLERVQYTFDASEESLHVSVDCGGDSLSKGEALISGIESVRFVLSDDHYRENVDGEEEFVNERGLSVEVEVVFPPLASDEQDERRRFDFRVARRGNII